MKLKLSLLLLALTGWGAFLLKPNPQPQVVEKVVTVDRIVTKNVHKVRTETLPNGNKVVTETKSNSNATEREQQIRTSTSELHVNSKYSLGLSVRLDPFNPLVREYELELGYRLWESPLWGTLAVSSNKQVSLGLRYEF